MIDKKEKFHIALDIKYEKGAGKKYSVNLIELLDVYHNKVEALQIFLNDHDDMSDLYFGPLGLVRNKDSFKQNIITSVLNVNGIEDLRALIVDYGLPRICDNYQLVFNVSELLNTIHTLQTILLLKKELSCNDPMISTVFSLYNKLVKTGTISINIYDLENPLPYSDEIEVTSFNFWGRKLLFSGGLYLENKQIVKDYMDNTWPDFDPVFHFRDTVTGEDVTGNLEGDFLDVDDFVKDRPFNIVIDDFYKHFSHFAKNNIHDLNTICLFHYLLKTKKDQEDLSIESFAADDFDSLAFSKLISFANSLCDAYLEKLISPLNIKYIDDIPTVIVTDLMTAIAFSLHQTDFSKYTIDQCKKPGCNRYFIRMNGRKNSLYCCNAHARSEAQKAYRHRPPKE